MEDLAQDCHAELLRKLPGFDPAKASPVAFAVKVLGNFLSNSLRDRQAARRDPRRLTSLGGPGAAAVPESGGDRHRRSPRSRQQGVDLRHDLEVALLELGPELRGWVERLSRQSVAAAARATGVPRTTPHSRLACVRRVFEKHNLAEYLGQPSSLRGATG